MMRELFEHVDLELDLFLLVLVVINAMIEHVKQPVSRIYLSSFFLVAKVLTSVTSITLMAASWPVLVWRPCLKR